MSALKRLMIICFLFFTSSECFSELPADWITGYENLMSEFKEPGDIYRPAPLWVWNNTLSEEFIDENLKSFKDAGIGAVYIHPRTGLQMAYLSKDWFHWVDYTLKVAEKLGIKVWIYDEYVCPSGFAGGIVPHEMPESYNQGVGLGAEYISILNDSDVEGDSGYYFKKENEKWVNITGKLKNESGKKGEFMHFSLRTEKTGKGNYGGYAYVDLLAEGVTRKFIEVTMSGYEKIARKHFGSLIAGIMTDEPQIGPSAGGIRYTPDLFNEFEERWGYSLEDHLPSLVEKTGNYRKIRHDYRTVLLEMFIDRWSRPWYEYTSGRHLVWTGHYWENTWPDLYMGPDNMAMYAWHHMPGIDMLFNSTDKRPDQFGNNIAVKELASVRNQFERHRSFSETYGGSGWDLSFEDMKRNGDWEFALGVNYLNLHLSLTSLVGVRKSDYPQSFMPYAPYWKLFRNQMDYFSRLSVAMSSGRQINRILLLEPTTSVWMHYPDRCYQQQVDSSFRSLVNTLEKYQIEYDLGSENIIAGNGKISGSEFGINRRFYNLVVLDRSVQNIDSVTFHLLKQYLRNGGRVLQFGNRLRYIDGRPDAAVKSLFVFPNWIREEILTQSIIDRYFLDPDFYMTPSVSGRIHHQHRITDDGDILFLANFSASEYAGTHVFAKGESVEELCEETGKTLRIPYVSENGKVDFTVSLPPGGSALYYIHKYKKIPPATADNCKLVELGNLPPAKVVRKSPNVLVLDYTDLELKGEKRGNMFYYTANKQVYNAFGFDYDPWQDVQFKTRYMDRNRNFRNGDSFTVTYSFEMSEGTDCKDMQLAVERGNLYKVSVNGHPAGMNGKFWLDRDFKCYDISGYVRPGKNTVELHADRFNVLCEISPVYITGRFSLSSQEKGWRMEPEKELKTGDWFTQGAPFYCGQVAYSKKICVESEGIYRISLPEWKGTVSEITVNGKSAGVISSQPYDKDIELEKGYNEVSVSVYGSLKSLFGPYHIPTRGYLRPASFFYGSPVQPSGKSYCLPEYGLIKDYVIYKKEE